MVEHPPRIGSLFSGYGGLDMGVQQAIGGTVAWHCEFDPNPSAILAHHWPTTPNLGDITTTDFTTVEQADIITGGFPCQDVSHAGRRKGLIRDGHGQTRSGLWGHMLRAINEQRPALVVAENVRGLLSATADSDVEPCPFCMGDDGASPMRALGAVLADLADVGYDAAWVGLPASGVGAPHGRFRVFILAWPAADPDCSDLRDAAREGPRPGDRLQPRGDGRPGNAHNPQGVTPCPTTSEDRSSSTATTTPNQTMAEGPATSAGMPSDTAPTTPDSPTRLTPASGKSSLKDSATNLPLLPTPAVNDMGRAYTPDEWDAWTEKMRAAHGNGNGHGASLHVEALRMLPTPRAGDGEKGGPNQRGSSGDLMLPSAVQLMPTPSVADVEGGRKTRSGARNDELLLNGIAHEQRFGEYTPAIARWEQTLGRPAPAPTEANLEQWERRKAARLNSALPVGMRGSIRFLVDGPPHRLSPRFVEWMMGLPDGHVTNVPDLSRNAQLKALGNGVVPQQAAEAVRWLLGVRASATEVAA